MKIRMKKNLGLKKINTSSIVFYCIKTGFHTSTIPIVLHKQFHNITILHSILSRKFENYLKIKNIYETFAKFLKYNKIFLINNSYFK